LEDAAKNIPHPEPVEGRNIVLQRISLATGGEAIGLNGRWKRCALENRRKDGDEG
jgi:hypothetical protein